MTGNRYDILFLNEQEVEQCVSYKEGIALIEETWMKTAAKQVLQFRTKHLEMGEGRFAYHIAYADGYRVATSLVPIFFDNPVKHGLTSISGLCVLFDPKTGVPVSIMSGHKYFRQVLTGCASAVTAKYYAKKDSNKLAMIGAGNQAVSHFLAMKEVFNLEEVRVFDISKEAQERFTESMGKYDIKIITANSIAEAMAGSDIVMTLTTANAPLVKKEWFEEGMVIFKIGSDQEMEPNVIMAADKVVVDWWDYIRSRSKEIDLLLKQGLISENDLDEKKFISAEMMSEFPELVSGRKKGRANDTEKILCLLLGLAAEYMVITTFAYNRAVEAELGVKFNLLSR